MVVVEVVVTIMLAVVAVVATQAVQDMATLLVAEALIILELTKAILQILMQVMEK
jgi:hypothetical protein